MWRTLGKAWLVLSGLGFAAFLLEEAFQVVTFASFVREIPASTRQVLLDTAQGILNALRIVNWINILNPPLFVAYSAYARAGRVWIEAQAAGYGLRPPVDRLDWVQDLLTSVGVLVAAVVITWAATRSLDKGGRKGGDRQCGLLSELRRRR